MQYVSCFLFIATDTHLEHHVFHVFWTKLSYNFIQFILITIWDDTLPDQVEQPKHLGILAKMRFFPVCVCVCFLKIPEVVALSNFWDMVEIWLSQYYKYTNTIYLYKLLKSNIMVYISIATV